MDIPIKKDWRGELRKILLEHFLFYIRIQFLKVKKQVLKGYNYKGGEESLSAELCSGMQVIQNRFPNTKTRLILHFCTFWNIIFCKLSESLFVRKIKIIM